MDLAERITSALGQKPVDLLLKNGQLVNVVSGEIHTVSIAVREGIVVGFGEYEAAETVDLEGRYVSPGFIDGHLHLESSMLSIPEFARNVVPLGTTSVVADPHEIGNVLGLDGIRYILESSEGLPLRVFVMFPSCVPATPFETSGAELGPKDMASFKDNERVLGLAEMMNYPGVLMEDPEILAKIKVFQDKVLDGHAPGLSGKDLCAYVIAGIGSDHECTSLEEAREKLRNGMHIMIREGSAAKNLSALLPLVNEHNSRNCFFVTDDLDPEDILEKGHINNLVRTAINKGLDPIRAIQMATINPAAYFRLKGLGRVAPGSLADLLILDDLKQVSIARVYQSGRLVAEAGKLVVPSVSRRGIALAGQHECGVGPGERFFRQGRGNHSQHHSSSTGPDHHQTSGRARADHGWTGCGRPREGHSEDRCRREAPRHRRLFRGAHPGIRAETGGHCLHRGPRFSQHHSSGLQTTRICWQRPKKLPEWGVA